jgi:hypothetical protein
MTILDLSIQHHISYYQRADLTDGLLSYKLLIKGEKNEN